MSHWVSWLKELLSQVSPPVALALIGVGMMLESMCAPIPSEMTLPLAGWWAERGKFGPGPEGFAAAFGVVTIGCLIGSSIAYAIGFYGGKPLVVKFGRYILVTPHRLAAAEAWLERFGPAAIILGRLMFAVRALISFPVGILQLGYRKFILLTLVGCSLWNGLGISLGYFYGEKVTQILHQMSVGMFVGVFGILTLLAGVYFWKTHFASPAAERSGTS